MWVQVPACESRWYGSKGLVKHMHGGLHSPQYTATQGHSRPPGLESCNLFAPPQSESARGHHWRKRRGPSPLKPIDLTRVQEIIFTNCSKEMQRLLDQWSDPYWTWHELDSLCKPQNGTWYHAHETYNNLKYEGDAKKFVKKFKRSIVECRSAGITIHEGAAACHFLKVLGPSFQELRDEQLQQYVSLHSTPSLWILFDDFICFDARRRGDERLKIKEAAGAKAKDENTVQSMKKEGGGKRQRTESDG
ncbi:hypothetical protein K461DRAFT_311986 [Myriangium duriaei CBS 260.36]|uniref:Uncharacterized protein n=1 Tax=Myriangium duriaei CBS 260.36 TaxID=1168546 RepID=A0A9P4J1Y4_9PEZI|nr:hypothetical protein K461DRAFT_311986 [Myriangium duriaei CBS 260.36]